MAFFTQPLFTEGVLPFLLVFVMIFAILQRSQLFGEGKKQIDALIALAVGLILIAVPGPRDFIVSIVPWMAVAVTVLLVVMVTYGMVGESDAKKGLSIPKWFAQTVLLLAIVFVIVVVFKLSGYWDTFYNWISSGNIGSTIIMVAIVGVALWVALRDPNSKVEYQNLASGK